ncbi:MAG: MBL fold metallo-hydrolase [Nibricoccus sp.]
MKRFTRRDWLKLSSAGVLGATVGLPGVTAVEPGSAAVAPVLTNSVIYRFRVGEFEAVSLLAGFMDTKPKRPPQADEASYQAALAGIGNPAKLRYPYNVLLLRRGAERILIDAGPPKTEGKPFHLLTSLAQLGVAPRDITHVFLTHAHFDHMGGLLDRQGKPVFGHAEHFCFAEEKAFWTADKPDFSKLNLNPGTMHADARRIFSSIQFTLVDGSTRLPEGITPILSPGHTPGQMTLRLESKGEVLHHVSDLTHHAMLWLPHPEWSLASDITPEVAIKTRMAAWAELAKAGTRVFGFHLPFPGLGKIGVADNLYRWVPEDWQPVL